MSRDNSGHFSGHFGTVRDKSLLRLGTVRDNPPRRGVPCPGKERVPGHSAAALHFALLTADEQAASVKRMAKTGWRDHGIANLTGLGVADVRRILASKPEAGQ